MTNGTRLDSLGLGWRSVTVLEKDLEHCGKMRSGAVGEVSGRQRWSLFIMTGGRGRSLSRDGICAVVRLPDTFSLNEIVFKFFFS